MNSKLLIFLSILGLVSFSLQKMCFPADFYWGTATAATQIEGAFKEDGKQLSIWDVFSHTPNKTKNGDTPDVADDHYHRIPEDIKIMKNLGVNSYRLSLAWTRIINYELLQNGEIRRTVNKKGIDHYLYEFDQLRLAGIEPFVTLFHWDLPQFILDNMGGYMTEKFVDEFLFYADTCFKYFGSQVKYWITFNEPQVFIVEAFYQGGKAPQDYTEKETRPYIMTHNVILAHLYTVRLLREKYQSIFPQQDFKIGITLNGNWGEPRNNTNIKHIMAAERYKLFQTGWFADPVFLGDYPIEMKKYVKERLPAFTEQQKQELLANKPDYFFINVYTARYVEDAPDSGKIGYSWDMHTADYVTDINGLPIGPQAESKWLYSVPWAMRKWMNWIANRYGKDTEIMITENGVSAPKESQKPISEAIKDSFRVQFLSDYITEMWKAMAVDGVKVKGYFLWSLLDNFEWDLGYTERFGIHYVDYKDQKLPRIAKDSSNWYGKLCQTRCLA